MKCPYSLRGAFPSRRPLERPRRPKRYFMGIIAYGQEARNGIFPSETEKKSADSPVSAVGLPAGFPAFVILLNRAFPVRAERRAAADTADRLAERLVIQLYADFIIVEIDGPVLPDAHAGGGFHRVDIGTEEQEFPAVLFLLPLHHCLDLIAGIPVGGILHPVRGDDEDGVLRHILFPGILMDVADVVDRPADRVDQGGLFYPKFPYFF